jgi:hypothetical protein
LKLLNERRDAMPEEDSEFMRSRGKYHVDATGSIRLAIDDNLQAGRFGVHG